MTRAGTFAVLMLGLSPVWLMGLIAALAIADEDNDTPAMRIYPDVASCQAEFGTAACTSAYTGAQSAHDGAAPRYGSLAECEQLYGPGGCMPRGDGDGGVFIPLMTGFLIGQALAGTTQVAYQPVYVNRQGVAFAGGVAVGTYASNCVGANCPRSSGGYIYASGSGGRSGIWTSGRYSIHTVSHGGGSAMAHSASISRGGFGSIAHAIGHIGG